MRSTGSPQKPRVGLGNKAAAVGTTRGSIGRSVSAAWPSAEYRRDVAKALPAEVAPIVNAMANQLTKPLDRPVAEARSTAELVSAAKSGEVRSPAFQRDFRWGEREVRDLFDSIWRGFPIGSLLLWQRDAPAAPLGFGSLCFEAAATPAALWVIDGQHRLTSLVATLTEHANPDPKFELYFDLETERFVRRGSRRRAPGNWLPLAVILDTNRLLDRLGNLRDGGLGREETERARDVARVIGEYKIPLAIVKSEEESVLREIFHRVNSAGHRLSSAEVFRALHAALGEGKPKDFGNVVDEVSSFGFGSIRQDTVLRCVLAIRGGDIYRSFVDEFGPGEDPAESFKSTAETMGRVFEFLRNDACIPHLRALPYIGAIPILTRFFFLHPDPHPHSRNLLRRWLWRATATGGRDVGVIRRSVQAVDQDESASITRLLDAVGAPDPPEIDLEGVQLNKATTRTNVSLLAALGPRDLRTGDEIDVGDLLNDDGADALLEIVAATERRLAGRLLHPAVADDLNSLLFSTTDLVLASHAITPETLRALRQGDSDTFLKLRAAELKKALEAQRSRLLEREASDRPPLQFLSVKDDE